MREFSYSPEEPLGAVVKERPATDWEKEERVGDSSPKEAIQASASDMVESRRQERKGNERR